MPKKGIIFIAIFVVIVVVLFLPYRPSDKSLFINLVSETLYEKIQGLKTEGSIKMAIGGIIYFSFESDPETLKVLKNELILKEFNVADIEYPLDKWKKDILFKPFGWYTATSNGGEKYYYSEKKDDVNNRYLITNLERTKYIVIVFHS